VFLEFLQGHMAGPEGSSKPLASPDGQYIAFAADYGHGLWKIVLCDLASGETWDFVDPDEYGGRGQSSELLITAWSPDSRELLYHVTTFDLDDPYRDYIERFFCARNIHTHENRTLVFPGKFDCWLPAGSFLVTRDGLPCVWDSAEDSIRNVTPSSRGGYFRQLTCDHSGQFLLANYCPTQYDRFSQIVRVDVSSGAVAAVSEVGEWARYQFPSSSPSGGHVAYMVMAGTLPLPTRTLVVDGRDMRVCRSYKWIDDDRIVVLDFDVLLVLDIHTGRVVGATQLAAE
jgi:Tol biopolymer transport system component